MTLELIAAPPETDHSGSPLSLIRRGRAARRERRRLAHQDRIAANLAELHHIQALVAGARHVINSGWIQNDWFAYPDETVTDPTVTDPTVTDPTVTDPTVAGHAVADQAGETASGSTVSGACLVGAIVSAGGGPAAAGTQPVQRALDLTWHTLFGGLQPIRWCPTPPVRVAHTCDLTRWNDEPGRTADEVTGLLDLVERAATVEMERLRAS
jgi:hypothetical protein